MTDTIPSLTVPLTAEEIPALLDEEGSITVIIEVGLDELTDNDLEGVLDIISDKVLGSCLLMGFSYEVSGVASPQSVYMKVTGDPSQALQNYDE